MIAEDGVDIFLEMKEGFRDESARVKVMTYKKGIPYDPRWRRATCR